MVGVGASGTLRATRRRNRRGDDAGGPSAIDDAGPTAPPHPSPLAPRELAPRLADDALLRAAQRDPLAFAPLYQRYATPVFRYCFRQTSDAEVAADLAAQVFTKALEALPRFRFRDERETTTASTTVRSWLFAIAHNTIVDHHRREQPTQSLNTPRWSDRPDHAETSDAVEALADPALGPEDLAIHQDDLRHLLAVLDRLPGNQRAIIELRLAGLTTAEVAQALRLTQPAVKAAQTRAYSRLRDLLEPQPSPQHATTSHPSVDSHPHPSPTPAEEASR